VVKKIESQRHHFVDDREGPVFAMVSGPEETAPKLKRVNLPDCQREEIFKLLLEVSVNRVLPRNTVKEVAARYGVSVQVVYGIWKRGIAKPTIGRNSSVISRRKGNVGRKLMYTDLVQRIKDAPPRETNYSP